MKLSTIPIIDKTEIHSLVLSGQLSKGTNLYDCSVEITFSNGKYLKHRIIRGNNETSLPNRDELTLHSLIFEYVTKTEPTLN